MKKTTAIGLGVAAVLVLGGGLALAGGGPPKKKIKAGEAGFVPGVPPAQEAEFVPPAQEAGFVPPGGYPPGFVPPSGPSRTGLTVGLDCRVNLYDTARARQTAYKLGRTKATVEEAQAALYNFGQCGLRDPLQVANSSLRGMHGVLYELLRGAAETRKISKPAAAAMLRDNIVRISLRGISTSGLPGALP